MSWTVPIRPAARPAWLRLQAAIDAAGPTVCRDRDEWISDNDEDREYAANHCGGCPVLRQCGEYADAAREREGVWAGVSRGAGKTQPTTIPLFDSDEETA